MAYTSGSVNLVVFGGHLGNDAELVHVGQDGRAKANFSVASTRRWSGNEGEQREATEWARCVLWGRRAEALAPHLTKGTGVIVRGRLQTRSWETEQGETRYVTEVIVEDLTFQSQPNQAGAGQVPQVEEELEEIPF